MFIAKKGEIKFVLAKPIEEDEERRVQFHRARHYEYVARKHWEPDRGGLEIDKFDHHSDFILGYRHEELVCGCRLVDGRKNKLPVAEEDSFSGIIKPGAVELSRMINRKKFWRVDGVRIDIVLLMVVADYLEQHRDSLIPTYVMMRQGFLRILNCEIWEALGSPVKIPGKGRFVSGLTNPVMFKENIKPLFA